MSQKCNFIFVYGTLKSNEPNCHLMENLIICKKFSYVGKGVLKEKRPLIIASDYNLPYLLDTTGFGNHVKGEIYKYHTNDALVDLDRLEIHPEHYERKVCKVIVLENDSFQELNCWVYILTDFVRELLIYPTIEEYYNGIMNKFYVDVSTNPPNFIQPIDFVKNKKINIISNTINKEKICSS